MHQHSLKPRRNSGPSKASSQCTWRSQLLFITCAMILFQVRLHFVLKDGEHKLDQFADTFYLFDTKIFNLCESMHDAWESHQPEQSCSVHMVGGFVYLLAWWVNNHTSPFYCFTWPTLWFKFFCMQDLMDFHKLAIAYDGVNYLNGPRTALRVHLG